MTVEDFWMHRALQLAAFGLGKAQPNPLVGAVIVHNESIIGEGFHQQYGMQHAEVNAIQTVENHELLREATLYVNVEPCAHFGNTPPCTSLIIEKKIPKVVVGIKDPNEKVNGKGIKILQEAGIEVIENVLIDECLMLNKRFINFHTKKRPYIFLKWAQTKNGFMDVIRNKNNNDNFYSNYWISNDALRVWTHKMRNEEQAILIGYNTFINDNPQLTNRFFGSNQPQRFVWCEEQKPQETRSSFSFLTGNIQEILTELYKLNIQSVIVEGGKKTLQKFLYGNCWNEVFILESNVKWETGIEAPKMPYNTDNNISIDGETVWHYSNKNIIDLR
jgi:diaminohydroxyphosphoribosylaminopyrimidine deaminase/5-amino-6-(5-phosphoribosylamino)uracil reductase